MRKLELAVDHTDDLTVYENSERLRVAIEIHRMIRIGDTTAKYLVVNEKYNLAMFEQRKPTPNVPVSDIYARETCKIGQRENTCRYLAASGKGWHCMKYSNHRLLFDTRVFKTQMGIATDDERINAQGDNCGGMKD